jgi:TatD DNase family protein
MVYDTHIHLDLYESFDEIISEIEKHQIYSIAVSNLPSLYIELKTKITSKFIKPALGFHPELLQQFEQQIPLMWDYISEARYIGEVGLDYNINKASHQLQYNFFVDLISKCHLVGGKILSVHSRSAVDYVNSIISNAFNGKVIMHWYSGSISSLKSSIEKGFYFSVNYPMTLSKNGQEIIRLIPTNRLLLESDGPFTNINKLPFRPRDIFETIQSLSKTLDKDVGETQLMLWNNFKTLLTD